MQILVGAGAAATTNVIGQLAHGVSLNQLNYASIGWSALQGGAFAAVGKAAMYVGCRLGVAPFCFAPDTPISTGQGFLPISIIEQFQEVWAFDLHAERWELKPVLETFAFDYEGDMAHVSLVGPAGEETIKATPGHPFWVIEGEGLDRAPRGQHIQAIESDLEGSPVPGRWVDAGDLRAGDVLLLKNSPPLRVERVWLEPYVGKVYNFFVGESHNYAVGFHAALVHNACNSAQLGKNLIAAGYPKPGLGWQAAHIVPIGAFSNRTPEVQAAIKLAQAKVSQYLASSGGLNSAANGFWSFAGHAGTHTDKYFLSLGRAFEGINNTKGALSVLSSLWSQIEAGAFL